VLKEPVHARAMPVACSLICLECLRRRALVAFHDFESLGKAVVKAASFLITIIDVCVDGGVSTAKRTRDEVANCAVSTSNRARRYDD
jgi:hypothetical protein